ncbi:hypothetical protein C8R44DRAFT_979343 [Mycena epipterygia]|nr:hypothetical protein C8R44DRAFT_979343 [Mycena epipterygia]
MLFQTTFVTLVLAVLATAGPTMLRRDDDLATFCFQDGSCFQASALANGCVDLPLFSQSFETASLSAPGLECTLSPDRGCVGNGAFNSGILLNSAGTVNLQSDLGLSTVASFICTSDVDLLNLCFASATQDCFQATTVTDGCANVRLFSDAFTTVSLTTTGSQCTLFQDPDCTGNSTFVAEPVVTFDLGSLGLSNVRSFSCTNTELPPPL